MITIDMINCLLIDVKKQKNKTKLSIFLLKKIFQ